MDLNEQIHFADKVKISLYKMISIANVEKKGYFRASEKSIATNGRIANKINCVCMFFAINLDMIGLYFVFRRYNSMGLLQKRKEKMK